MLGSTWEIDPDILEGGIHAILAACPCPGSRVMQPPETATGLAGNTPDATGMAWMGKELSWHERGSWNPTQSTPQLANGPGSPRSSWKETPRCRSRVAWFPRDHFYSSCAVTKGAFKGPLQRPWKKRRWVGIASTAHAPTALREGTSIKRVGTLVRQWKTRTSRQEM